ncbi:hypothetical protein MBLNU459_g6816t2 [Dothideomycetes sp. NU459]
MAAMSRGTDSKAARPSKPSAQVVKPRRAKHQTPSSRRHHFESFSQRIAKLKIDPVRRTRRGVGAEGSHEVEKESSYFRTALEEWKDLNMSEAFTAFAKEVYPLSESLAMVLHYEDRIMDCLMSYIAKGDSLSLEPLLALLSHFAHDLDVRFENHFQRAVGTITQVAAKHADAEAIEWTFTCLAWLFKYLSRLLVPDLRPLYDLMAPFLGKERQKPFVIRFAAEAMSFLVRKAGTAYHKNKDPLHLIVTHALRDFAGSSGHASNELYAQGLMTLFTESIKGIQGTLHSGGNAVLQCLTAFCFEPEHHESLKNSSLDILRGSVISVLHHTDYETFKPILDAVLDMTDLTNEEGRLENIDAATTLLFTIASVRKGSRIADWSPFIRRVTGLIKTIDMSNSNTASNTKTAVLNTLAVVLNYAPLDAVLPEIAIFDSISRGQWKRHFLPFCNMYADLNVERFQSLLLSHFQRFLVSNWEENETSLCALLPALADQGVFAKNPMQCPLSWQNRMLDHLKKASQASAAPRDSKDAVSICNGNLSVLRATQGDPKSRESISACLLTLLKDVTKRRNAEMSPWDLFALGQGFLFISDFSTDSLQRDHILGAICAYSNRVNGLIPYWKALNAVLEKSEVELDLKATYMDTLTEPLIECLSASSHDLRLVALKIMRTIYSQRKQDIPEILEIALSIEETHPTVQTARFISAQIRRLAAAYPSTLSDAYLAKAIPTYCFGILHIQLAQAWDDAVLALKDMAQHEQGEEVVSRIISLWLRGADGSTSFPSAPAGKVEAPLTHVSSEFECSNLNLINRACERSSSLLEDAQEELCNQFERDHARTSLSALSNRSQALRALNGMPQFAEKRSRLLVPVMLEWAGEDIDEEAITPADQIPGQSWSRKDQKAMLSIFAQFQNPRVLFKSSEVYQALLSLMSNGDVEIQRSALKAVLAWKATAVNKYQDHLNNLLDDARFREEISVFLRLDQEGDAIRSEDCPDLMPVLLRLLYGKAVTRAGSASGKRGQQTRRKAIFVGLARFPEETVGQFLDIALGSLGHHGVVQNGAFNQRALDDFSFPTRKQVGLLNMLEDMLQTLGNKLGYFATKIADAVLLCLLRVSRLTNHSIDTENVESTDETQTSLDRAIRQAGFHCLNQLFSACTDVSWHDYAAVIMTELVAPRLEKLPIDTAQSVSGILQFYPETLGVVAECLAVPSAKNEVKLFIVENVIGKLLDLVQPPNTAESGMKMDATVSQEESRRMLLEPNASLLVVKLGTVLRQNPPKELLDASVLCVSRLAPLVSGAENIRDVIDVSIFLLGQPPKTVHFTTKRDLLQTLYHLIPAAELSSGSERFDQTFATLCPLFAFFKDRESRELLSVVMRQLTENDEELAVVAGLCEDLNSFSVSRLDEPDFERRSGAFNAINESKYKELSATQWRPLVFNMLYYIKDNEELAIRTNASFSLRRFIEAASWQDDFKNVQFRELLSTGLLPALQNGMREPSELVRSEFLSVTAHLVKHLASWTAVNDMRSLLVDDDDEASFFMNILHIQQHRRLRALRRLATEASSGVISSPNVSNFFIPLLEHFIFDPAGDDSAHNLAAETIHSVGALTGCLEWTQYRTTLRRFIGYVQSKQELQKTVLRLVSAVIDALDQAANPSTPTASESTANGAGGAVGEPTIVKLSKTLPPKEKLAGEINKQFLPPLTDFLHLKDESTVSLRVPVAVSVIKLIRVLPVEEHGVKLPSVLMDVCHILRSKSSDARDMTRKTLAEITAILGPTYFHFVLKELRSALQRGYQLHVMSFTVHSILVENSSTLKPGDLDSCLPDIVAVIMDDIFGVAGQEKDAEEYISKMKEVKSSKSYDSMELVSKITTLQHLGQLIRPVQTLLMEKVDLKTVKKIDELLRRVGLGTTQNAAVKDRDILIFCYEIVQQVHAAIAAASGRRHVVEDYKIRKYLIQMQSANKSGKKGATTSYSFKLTRFALDLVRSVVQRHEDLKTSANVAGFLPIIGDSLIGGQEEVQMAAVRLLTAVIKVPSPQIAENASLYASEAVKIIRAAPSTTTELAQAALKLVSAVLKERPNANIKDNDLAYVIKRLKPDLEQPDRQGVIFNFLKAILTRKVISAEVYEVMDTVAAIMVTNQTRTARDLARGIYFQFIMEYPQASNRLAKQIGFLVKNLEYDYVEGRQSVLELLHLLLSKTNGDLVQELSSMLFVPLVMMMVNDESAECREMAGALISKILDRADEERTKNFVSLMRTWLEQDEQALLRRIALQCWIMYLGSEKATAKDTSFLFKQLSQLLNSEDQTSEEWELLYYSLQAFAKLCETASATALAAGSKSSWASIFRCLIFPHAWVKLSAARLVGLLFADLGSTSAKIDKGLAALPLQSSGGLRVTEEEMQQLCSASLRILRFQNVTEQLVTQTARNLIFLGRCYGANDAIWKDTAANVAAPNKDADDDADVEDDEDYEEEADGSDAEESSDEPKTALSHLFARLSAIVRRDAGALTAPSLAAKTGSLQATAALCNALSDASLSPSLETIMLPLYVLTDSSIPEPKTNNPALAESYKALVALAHETMNLLQKKLGTGVYVNVMGKVQETVRSKREDRRRKRRIEAVSAPEKWAKDKRKKQDIKKFKRKEKSHDFRGQRRGW